MESELKREKREVKGKMREEVHENKDIVFLVGQLNIRIATQSTVCRTIRLFIII